MSARRCAPFGRMPSTLPAALSRVPGGKMPKRCAASSAMLGQPPPSIVERSQAQVVIVHPTRLLHGDQKMALVATKTTPAEKQTARTAADFIVADLSLADW